MRPFYFLPMLAVLAACESGVDVAPAVVQWMEWPAEVPVATPFSVRLLVPRVSCRQGTFRSSVAVDQSAVTFAPYFLLRGPAYCPPTVQAIDLPYFALDTVGTAPGLDASYARTFEMRASTSVYAPTPSPSTGDQPVRTFGDVTVRLSNPDGSRRNAAGFATTFVDNAGCVRVLPARPSGADAGWVLEDQADTMGLTYAFVRGYIHEAATPVCGQTRVFHLVSRN
jgi:hypothetical protein